MHRGRKQTNVARGWMVGIKGELISIFFESQGNCSEVGETVKAVAKEHRILMKSHTS